MMIVIGSNIMGNMRMMMAMVVIQFMMIVMIAVIGLLMFLR